LVAYVLVHGGYHTSWCWSDIAAALTDHGHWVRTVDLPGRGDTAHLAATTTLDDWVAALEAVVKTAPTPPVVVAHSLGGVTANQHAERYANDIARVVYVCALAPLNGESGTSTMLEAGSDSAFLQDGAFVPGTHQTVVMTEATAREGCYGLCSDSDTEQAVAHLCPEPITPMVTPVTLGTEFYRVPKTYIATRDDKAVPLPFQVQLANRMDATLEVINGDHSPFLSAPKSLLAALLKQR
jgi:pimeloyl-ACP methyl ester carboxylesterase